MVNYSNFLQVNYFFFIFHIYQIVCQKSRLIFCFCNEIRLTIIFGYNNFLSSKFPSCIRTLNVFETKTHLKNVKKVFGTYTFYASVF